LRSTNCISSRGFTKNYDVIRLVWYEAHNSIETAIQREKRIKTWKRTWKLALFAELNPRWEDLYPQIAGGNPVPPSPSHQMSSQRKLGPN